MGSGMETFSYARQCLEQWGAKIVEIATSDKEEADFLVEMEGCRILVEEKTKFDDENFLLNRSRLLAEGKLHESFVPLVRNNRLSGIVTKAAKQLRSSSTPDMDFHLVWFTATGVHAEAKYRQFIATLYGTTNIIEMDGSHYRRCYFFRNSDFHRHADVIDGAIVAYVSGSDIGARLCLNPLSANTDALRASVLAEKFGTAVEDPILLEQKGEAYLLDGAVDRRDRGACLAFLQRKYRTGPLDTIDLGYLSAEIGIVTAKE